jgi:hypothetical protein
LGTFKDEGADAGRNATTVEGAMLAIEHALADAPGPITTKDQIRAKARINANLAKPAFDALYRAGKMFLAPDGYRPDSPALRTERVLEQVRTCTTWNGVRQLANAAHVKPGFVDELLRSGVIHYAVGMSARGGFIVGLPSVIPLPVTSHG